MSWTTYESPIGPLTLVGGPGGLRRVHFPGGGLRVAAADRDPAALAGATAQLDEYFAGDRRTFDLDLELAGTDFQRIVWRLLRRIPYGETVSYGALAAAVARERGEGDAAGGPDGYLVTRAVAAAVGRTPTPIVVPCHRVIGADGSLTGYGGGLRRKQALLELEAAGGGPKALADRWAQRQLALL